MGPHEVPTPPASREELSGYKRAYIVAGYTPTGQIRGAAYRAHVHDVAYRSGETAVCAHNPHHQAPQADCTCGYYALRDKAAVQNRSFSGAARTFYGSSAILTVTLWGREVIEGSRGLRGANQTILQVTFDRECYDCGRGGDQLGAGRAWRQDQNLVWRAVEVICTTCAGRRLTSTLISIATLSGLLETEVRVAAPLLYAATRRSWQGGSQKTHIEAAERFAEEHGTNQEDAA